MKRQTVIIVDDTPANIVILSKSLGDDYELIFATSGDEALELIGSQKPDLILLDVMMPDMDGYQLCTLLKGDPATRDIPIVFVTAMCQEEDEVRGLELGAIDYLTKPISPAIVRARVRNHLELKRYRDLLETLSQTADRAKQEFLRCIGHELRTPLTPIIGMTDLVLTCEEDDDKRRYLTMVQHASLRLLGMVEDLIETSRLAGQGISLQLSSFELRPFLAELMAELDPVARRQGLDFGMELEAALPERISADPGLLRKVLVVLLGNALKFTAEGSVALQVRTRADLPLPVLRFSVSDTGVGIPPADLGRIFHDFTQSDSSVTRTFPGLGLGLTLARRITEAMDGRIWAEGRPGGGSLFHIEIPLAQPSAGAATR